MEAVVSRSVAVFGLLFGTLTFPVMLGQVELLHPVWFWAFAVAIFGGLLAAVAATVAQRFVRAVNAWIAFSYLSALATWSSGYVDPSTVSGERPWLWFMCTVATAAAAIAFSRWVAALYLVVAPTIYGIIRLTPSGGGEVWDLAALDTLYAILLGGAVLVIVTMLRDAATNMDAAQATALARYAQAVRQHATEVERVRVDSIVHDSVLATLSSAARAFTPEAQALAATMAGNAIGHLRAAATLAPDDESLMGVEQVAERIVDAAATMSEPFAIKVSGVGAGTMHLRVAEALHSAAVQAMVNSLQHAGSQPGVTRWLRISGVEADGLDIEIGDSGRGFDVQTVPAERLGLRVSIVERVTNAGGWVRVSSQPDAGAIINIRWPNTQVTDGGVPL